MLRSGAEYGARPLPRRLPFLPEDPGKTFHLPSGCSCIPEAPWHPLPAPPCPPGQAVLWFQSLCRAAAVCGAPPSFSLPRHIPAWWQGIQALPRQQGKRLSVLRRQICRFRFLPLPGSAFRPLSRAVILIGVHLQILKGRIFPVYLICHIKKREKGYGSRSFPQRQIGMNYGL